jgi:hypothetical protein
MKRVLLVVFMLPFLCNGQSIRLSTLAENRVDEFSHDTIATTYWHTLSHGTISDPLNISFRICRINSSYSVEIKMMDAGTKTVVPKNAAFEISLENGELVTLYNSEYQGICRGCGAINYNGNDAPGITLIYPLNKADIVSLQRSYISNLKLYSAEGYWHKKVNERNSELFMNYIELAINARLHPVVGN